MEKFEQLNIDPLVYELYYGMYNMLAIILELFIILLPVLLLIKIGFIVWSYRSDQIKHKKKIKPIREYRPKIKFEHYDRDDLDIDDDDLMYDQYGRIYYKRERDQELNQE